MLKKWWVGYALAGVIALGAGFYVNHTGGLNQTRGIASATAETVSDTALEQMDLGEDTTEEQAIDAQALPAPEQSKGLTCREMYQKIAADKNIRNVAIARSLTDITIVPSSILGVIAALFLAPTVPVAGLIMIGSLTPAATSIVIYTHSTPKEEKVLLLGEGHIKKFYRLLKKARKIRPDVTEQNIMEIVNQGIDSGEFCQNFPKLYSPRQVREYVLAQVASAR